MSEPYSLRTLAHRDVAPEAMATLIGLSSAAYIGSSAASTGQYALAGFALLAILGLVIALKRVDDRAREVARQKR